MKRFLLGCSFTWEEELREAGLSPRHIDGGSGGGSNVAMFRTNVECTPSGVFRGEMVVSMRPYPEECVPRLQEITGKYPGAHGAPVHWGRPADIGIENLSEPDFGDMVEVAEGEVPVFWACGVTPQTAVENARLPLAITHCPGYMFVSDVIDEEVAVFMTKKNVS